MFNTYGVCVGICFILFSLGSAAGQAGRNTAQQPTIRHISIEGNTRTREAKIRRELLFSEGEPLDSMLVVESARNLRRFFPGAGGYSGAKEGQICGCGGQRSRSVCPGVIADPLGEVRRVELWVGGDGL